MVDINVGALSEAINDKMDRDALNATGDAFNNMATGSSGDYIIDYQMPTLENDYTWYRLYKSGWVEQGGYKAQTTWDVDVLVSLPITMNDANYTILTTLRNDNTNAGFANVDNSAGITNSSFYFRLTSKANALFSPLGMFWEVKGMSKQD